MPRSRKLKTPDQTSRWRMMKTADVKKELQNTERYPSMRDLRGAARGVLMSGDAKIRKRSKLERRILERYTTQKVFMSMGSRSQVVRWMDMTPGALEKELTGKERYPTMGSLRVAASQLLLSEDKGIKGRKALEEKIVQRQKEQVAYIKRMPDVPRAPKAPKEKPEPTSKRKKKRTLVSFF